MRRHGFTLVEMLVSLALVLFIMYILSQALSTGLETFRQLKATGELEEKLRMVSTILRADLKLDHFEGRRRLSDPGFWRQGPPREGFFHIEQRTKSTREGRDGDLISSWSATTHSLHFSIKLRGSQREDFLSATIPPVPGFVPPDSPLLTFTNSTTFFNYQADSRYQDTPNAYNSQWAEVTYFLHRDPNGPTVNGTPLYALYRRQRLAIPNNYQVNWGNARIQVRNQNELQRRLAQHSAVSCEKAQDLTIWPDTIYFNTPTDLTVPERRFLTFRVRDPTDPTNPNKTILFSQYTPLGTGEDLLLTDVISFTVRILSPDVLNQQPKPPVRPYDHVDDPLVDIPNTFIDLPLVASFRDRDHLMNPMGIGAFDTWSTVHDEMYDYSQMPVPLPIHIKALQIMLRIYDLKTQQTRQVTITQEM